ncbi:cobalt-precorrin-6A reductase (plasmid) [Kovacikia minuta CCNUW1]|uniref:cobalt-precorrin-6A reductase n=1 Tax=Kovacikia minuta TaxID=2931930 RepID=UPI001CCA8097|nr:cobalt-precorrin-6A reductase [Kovacikia minuta]UBF30299.1 cobalt-precorrin-6A reductase [Kovacikia minuta CCNUW1]
MARVLILGGTGDAAELAAKVSFIRGVDHVITSLAGRTRHPSVPEGRVRVGGFGGSTGLAAYLREHQIDILIDATHPFAAQISWHAAEAAKSVAIPHLMLVRPAWNWVTGDHWIEVENTSDAAQAIPATAKRVFLTIGRQELAPFAPLVDRWFLMRMIDPPAPDAIVPQGEVLCDRGPFTLDNERQLLIHYRIDAIVSKNSGGDATYAKIIAARELGIPIIMVQRPAIPPSEQVATAEQALAWLTQVLQ